MKTFTTWVKMLLAVLLLTGSTSASSEGFITGFKASIIKDEKYGNTILKVTPAKYNPDIPANTKLWGVWGILICYEKNGEQKVVRQDMTYDIMKQGFYDYPLGYTENTTVRNISLIYFDVRQNSSEYPPKTLEMCNELYSTKVKANSGSRSADGSDQSEDDTHEADFNCFSDRPNWKIELPSKYLREYQRKRSNGS